MLVTTQPGQLRVYEDGALEPTAALDLSSSICSNNARGLLGVAVDPAFATNHFIYLFYTHKNTATCPFDNATTPVDRVSRFTLSDSNSVNPVSELVLLDNLPSYEGNHDAGDLHFGKDGYLYVSVGDSGCDYLLPPSPASCNDNNGAAQRPSALNGKVLRITAAGGIPPDNPFLGENTVRCNETGRTVAPNTCREIFALGFRNPFRLIFDPNAETTRFLVNDVGLRTWEEIDEAQAGGNFGWNEREGFCESELNSSTAGCDEYPAEFVAPLFVYGHGDGCRSITGGGFVPVGAWPTSWDGAYLFGDYVCGKIFRLVESTPRSREDFATGLGSGATPAFGPVTMVFGPEGALYYTSYANGGEVRRIAYTGSANRTPTARFEAEPGSGAASLTVAFDATTSTDPNPGDTLEYLWDFGDGETSTVGAATTTHTYEEPGTYEAELRVRDDEGATSLPARASVSVSAPLPPPPQPIVTQDLEAPALGISVALRQRIAALLRRGMAARIRCSEPCSLRAQLRLTPKLAKRLKLPLVIGSSLATLAADDPTRIVIKVKPRAKRRLARLPAFRITLRVQAIDAAGNSRMLNRRIALRR